MFIKRHNRNKEQPCHADNEPNHEQWQKRVWALNDRRKQRKAVANRREHERAKGSCNHYGLDENQQARLTGRGRAELGGAALGAKGGISWILVPATA